MSGARCSTKAMSGIPSQSDIRNLKDGDWYWIHRKVLQLYGKKLRSLGMAVYSTLACFADAKTQSCFPSRNAIARLLGVSQRTVTRKIRLLKQVGLVRVVKVKGLYRYFLLKLPQDWTAETPGVDSRDHPDWTRVSTSNNNQLIKINNNNDMGIKFKRRDELLAMELSEALNDRQGFKRYLALARRYSESLLRRTLSEVKAVPEEKIKKGRAAFFNYLIRKHVQNTA
jgi:DNA-binding transcriptional ArsR family regulator